ncbi:MAG: hypothetical protein GYB65_05075 [Chloroflexi bacterium]|nr:hypothetical protein [Chloroflexota bacterium]
MNGYEWVGVIVSTFVTTLALGSWFSMAVPYFDNAPYLQELKRHMKIAWLIGVIVFVLFFSVFYIGARYLDEDTSGPVLIFGAFVLALPFSLLIGTETWEHYNAKQLNKMPGVRAVGVATLTGLAEISAASLLVILIL